MSWLTNFVRPTLRRLVSSRAREAQWIACPRCGATVFHRDLDAAWRVCPACGHHLPLSAARRIELLLDEESWARIEIPAAPADPLKFRDSRRYADRLKEAGLQSRESESVAVAHGTLDGRRAVVAAFESRFLGGSFGAAAGEALVAAAELAVLQQAPLILAAGSRGPRVQDGPFSLIQLPRATIALVRMGERGLPVIGIAADPLAGPMATLLLQQADVVLAEPGARVAPPAADPEAPVPDDAPAAEDLLARGMIDRIVARADLKAEIGIILDALRSPLPPPRLSFRPAAEAPSPPLIEG